MIEPTLQQHKLRIRIIPAAMSVALVCLAGAPLASGQTRPEQRPLMSEQAFKNIQVLKGLPVNQFMATMGFFSASLGENCTFCHVAESGGSWEKYADDNGPKKTARAMIGMMNGINKTYFGGRRVLTCYSCHRGGERPRVTPSIADLYGPPPIEEPDTLMNAAPRAASADQVLDKYLQALGGAQKLASVTSLVGKGTYQGYAAPKEPVEVYAKAPAQRTIVVHTSSGDSTTVYDGQSGWISAPTTERPVPVVELTGGDLDGAKLDGHLFFPATIKQTLTQWRAGYPATIDDHEVQVLQGTVDGQHPVNLYFDSKSGLLLRVVRYADSPVGLNPTQTDYSDYRDVAGIKMPFRWTVSWLDGRSTTELSELRANVPIDASRFSKPSPPAAPPASKK